MTGAWVSRWPDVIGTHVVKVGTLDISCLVDSVSIHHGRDDSDSQPVASSCTVDISTNTAVDPLPSDIDIGAAVTVDTTVGGTTYRRFTGSITDITQGWDDAGEATPDYAVMQVIATGPLASLGRKTVGAVPFPQELDGARVSRIMTAAGITLNPATSDPGTVQILARDIDSQPALDVSQAVASDASGVVWETKAGEIRYADAVHRHGTVPGLSIDACDVLVTPSWRKTTEGLVNDVSIGYGITPEGSEQPRYTASNAGSIARWGTFGLSTATQLAALADAQAMGDMLLVRNSQPVWIMTDLPVDIGTLDAGDTGALLSLDMHDLVNLTGLPAAGSVPTVAVLWLEGWQESLAYGSHEIQLTVSGYCRTAPAPWWDWVDPNMSWDQAPGTWDEATCVGPLPTTGRWADVPATMRWDQAPGAWDEWTGAT